MIKRMIKRKFNFRPRPIARRFKQFKKMAAKTKHGLKTLVNKSPNLEKAIKVIFSKKTAAVAAAGTAVGIGISSIWDYIESNSGCFLKKTDGSVCKIREFSCCQKDPVDNVPFCDGAQAMANACDGFDEEKEKSCCKLCDCQHLGCLPNETMQCQRPTVADALNHFSTQFGSTIWSGIENFFPWISYVFYGIVIIFIIWILNMIVRMK